MVFTVYRSLIVISHIWQLSHPYHTYKKVITLLCYSWILSLCAETKTNKHKLGMITSEGSMICKPFCLVFNTIPFQQVLFLSSHDVKWVQKPLKKKHWKVFFKKTIPMIGQDSWQMRVATVFYNSVAKASPSSARKLFMATIYHPFYTLQTTPLFNSTSKIFII